MNDKLQGSAATYMYLRCGGVVNNQVKKGLLLSLPVKKIIIGEHLSKLQARTRLSPAICSSFSCVVARRISATGNTYHHRPRGGPGQKG